MQTVQCNICFPVHSSTGHGSLHILKRTYMPNKLTAFHTIYLVWNHIEIHCSPCLTEFKWSFSAYYVWFCAVAHAPSSHGVDSFCHKYVLWKFKRSFKGEVSWHFKLSIFSLADAPIPVSVVHTDSQSLNLNQMRNHICLLNYSCAWMTTFGLSF